MNTPINLLRSRGTLALLAGIGLLLPAAQVKAQDDAYAMAPPVDYYNAPVSGNSVFNWAEVPQNQVVPIARAVFDQGGYQLYDQAGETIVVPFQNNNLYVMKFALSETGQTYFVNDEGQAPILYVPENGYLENATVGGARWYPFNRHFCPSQPVFLGIAPSYSEFISMGWYPDEVCSGGFYSDVSFVSGGFFGPTIGLTFIFGGQHYHGWDGYREYADNYPAPYHTGWSHRDYYQFAGRPDFNRTNSFTGFSGQTQFPSGRSGGFGTGGNRGFGGGNSFPGSNRPTFGGTSRQPVNAGQYPSGTRPTFGGGQTSRPTFGGGATSQRPTFGSGTTGSRPTFGGATSRPSFDGGSSGGGESSRPTFGGGSNTRPTFGGSTASRPDFEGAGNRPSFGGGTTSRPSFGGATASRPTFGGATSRPSFGGRSFPTMDRTNTQDRPSFGGTQTARSNGGFGGTQAPRGNSESFPSARGSDNDRPAPRSNDTGNNSSSRSFGNNGSRNFDGR